MSTQGTATLNFGAFPGGAEASVAVTGQAGIVAGSAVEAFMMGTDTTADHNADEHTAEKIDLTITAIAAGTGFTIYANVANGTTFGSFLVHWVWN